MISCNLHDYIEIVCLYRYPVSLQLKSGEVVAGTAVDTDWNIDREECIKIEKDSREKLVVLDAIASMQVTVDNPHIDKVSFEDGS